MLSKHVILHGKKRFKSMGNNKVNILHPNTHFEFNLDIYKDMSGKMFFNEAIGLPPAHLRECNM